MFCAAPGGAARQGEIESWGFAILCGRQLGGTGVEQLGQYVLDAVRCGARGGPLLGRELAEAAHDRGEAAFFAAEQADARGFQLGFGRGSCYRGAALGFEYREFVFEIHCDVRWSRRACSDVLRTGLAPRPRAGGHEPPLPRADAQSAAGSREKRARWRRPRVTLLGLMKC